MAMSTPDQLLKRLTDWKFDTTSGLPGDGIFEVLQTKSRQVALHSGPLSHLDTKTLSNRL